MFVHLYIFIHPYIYILHAYALYAYTFICLSAYIFIYPVYTRTPLFIVIWVFTAIRILLAPFYSYMGIYCNKNIISHRG